MKSDDSLGNSTSRKRNNLENSFASEIVPADLLLDLILWKIALHEFIILTSNSSFNKSYLLQIMALGSQLSGKGQWEQKLWMQWASAVYSGPVNFTPHLYLALICKRKYLNSRFAKISPCTFGRFWFFILHEATQNISKLKMYRCTVTYFWFLQVPQDSETTIFIRGIDV